MNTTIGILAMQGDFQAHAAALAQLDIAGRYIRKPSDLDGLAGLILPGGESTTVLKLLESEGLWEPVRQFAQTHPMFGTCAGAILMADRVENPSQTSLGLMRMTVRRNAYGRQVSSSIRHADAERDLDAGRKPGPPLEAVLIRAPIITETGPKVQTLASVDGRPILVRQGHLLAATFHPELTSDTRVHRYFSQMVWNNQKESAANEGSSK